MGTRSPSVEGSGRPNVALSSGLVAPPGYFNRHFNIPALIQIAESLRASGRKWPENATTNGAAFFDKAMALCESMQSRNGGHLRAQPRRCLRVRASIAIFVLPRTATT